MQHITLATGAALLIIPCSSPLVDLIVSQVHDVSSCFVNQIDWYPKTHATQPNELQEFPNSVYDQLPPDLSLVVLSACFCSSTFL